MNYLYSAVAALGLLVGADQASAASVTFDFSATRIAIDDFGNPNPAGSPAEAAAALATISGTFSYDPTVDTFLDADTAGNFVGDLTLSEIATPTVFSGVAAVNDFTPFFGPTQDSLAVDADFDSPIQSIARVFLVDDDASVFGSPTSLPASIDLAEFETAELIISSINGEGELAVIFQITSITPATTPVPLPAAGWMLLLGVAGLGAAARRRSLREASA